MPVNTLTIILSPVPIGIYLLSLLSGISLWRGRSFGRKASIIIQLIQLPKIISPALIFMFSFGFDFWIHYLLHGNFSTLGFEFRFLAFQQFFSGVEDAPLGFGLSIPAFIFLIILFNYKPGSVKDEFLPPPPEITEVTDNSEATPNKLIQPEHE